MSKLIERRRLIAESRMKISVIFGVLVAALVIAALGGKGFERDLCLGLAIGLGLVAVCHKFDQLSEAIDRHREAVNAEEKAAAVKLVDPERP